MKATWNKLHPFIRKNTKTLVGGSALCLILLWSVDAGAGALDQQLDKINTLAQGKFLKVGLGIATVIGTISAILKGSIALAASIIGIAILLSFFLGWVQSDKFVQGITA